MFFDIFKYMIDPWLPGFDPNRDNAYKVGETVSFVDPTFGKLTGTIIEVPMSRNCYYRVSSEMTPCPCLVREDEIVGVIR